MASNVLAQIYVFNRTKVALSWRSNADINREMSMNKVSGTAGFMAMKGDGYYSKATIGAKHVMDKAASLVLDAVARMDPADDGSIFRATDMGAADGGTSVDLWRRVFRDVRARVPSRPIEMVYTDLPRNDFAQVFRMIHGQTDISSYYPEIDDLYVFASGTSFHQNIFPPQTLDLGFSATASHYISATPCNIYRPRAHGRRERR